MVVLGVSLVFLSISFLCYRHPPRSWPWSWPSLPLLRPGALGKASQSRSTTQKDQDHTPAGDIHEVAPLKELPSAPSDAEDKRRRDQEAMPPPSIRPAPAPSIATVAPPDPPSLVTMSNIHLTSPPPGINSPSRSSTSSSTLAITPPLQTPPQPRGPPRLAPLTQPRQQAGLMPPPARPTHSRLPPPTSSSTKSSLRIPASTAKPTPLPTGLTPNPRSKKVILAPNHSPLDWAALQPSLHPPSPLLRVTPSQLKQRNGRKGRESWTVLGGRVYDLGPYKGFHPGGEGELLRCAGKEGGTLFQEVHPWVNWQGMLGGCLVGIFVSEAEGANGSGAEAKGSILEEMD